MKFKYITKTVWLLGLVSLFTDMASEDALSVMPIYLESIGFSILLIGILEGLAEATAGLSKGYFGNLSDAKGKRLPFVRLGYGLSAVAKPLLAAVTHPLWVFSLELLNVLERGSEPVPAMPCCLVNLRAGTRAGSLDFTALWIHGAVAGPLLALAFPVFLSGKYRILFWLAFIPGVMAIVFTSVLREIKVSTDIPQKPGFLNFLQYWKDSSPKYRHLIIGLLIFALFNSSDVFLLLKAKETGLDDTMVIGVYIFYNLVYAICAYPLGILADKAGLKTVLLSGLVLFAVVYAGMAFAGSLLWLLPLFLLYGVYAAATEGISKAWITNIAESKDAATAVGTYTAFQSICMLIASSLTGLIWYSFGSMTALLTTSIMTLAAVAFLMRQPIGSPHTEQTNNN